MFKTIREFVQDRRGDEYAQKAIVVLLVVIAGIAAMRAFGDKIVELIRNATNGLG